jgi:hypothetical protein
MTLQTPLSSHVFLDRRRAPCDARKRERGNLVSQIESDVIDRAHVIAELTEVLRGENKFVAI